MQQFLQNFANMLSIKFVKICQSNDNQLRSFNLVNMTITNYLTIYIATSVSLYNFQLTQL